MISARIRKLPSRFLLALAYITLASCSSGDRTKTAKFIKPDQYCGYEAGDTPNRLELLTGDDYRPKTLVSRITAFSGLRDKFEVRYANIPNAAAAIVGEKRYILINPGYMEYVKNEAGTNWAIAIVLAHEIGHHLSGHTLEKTGSRPEKELEADQYSGYVLNLMGASLRETLNSRAGLRDIEVVTTHPKRADRLQAIENGWRLAKQNKQPPPSGLNHAMVLTPEEKLEHENRLAEERERIAMEKARLREEEERKALYEMITPIAEFNDTVVSTQVLDDGTSSLFVQFTLEIRNAQAEKGQVVLLFSNAEKKLLRDKDGLGMTPDGHTGLVTTYALKAKNIRFPHVTMQFPLNQMDLPVGQHAVYPLLRYYELRENGVRMLVKQVRLSKLGLKVTAQ